MPFTGYLSKFSLPELLLFLEEGHKTGLLTIRKLSSSKSPPNLTTEAHYIWFQQGRILAAADRLDNQGLISILIKRGWYSDRSILKSFENQNLSTKTTMGLYFKSQGIVKAEQLILLFRAQVTENISPLFQLQDAEFNFESNASLPFAEMTGLSMPATEATLMGLRSLQQWSQLAGKLPDSTSSILAKVQGVPKIRLEYTESQVWKYANGNSSLQKISEELQLSLEKVQQIAFRLIVSNLAEEVFILKSASKATDDTVKEFTQLDTSNKFKELDKRKNSLNLAATSYSKVSPANKKDCERENSSVANQTLDPNLDTVAKTNVSQSFLQNLVGFLQNKIDN